MSTGKGFAIPIIIDIPKQTFDGINKNTEIRELYRTERKRIEADLEAYRIENETLRQFTQNAFGYMNNQETQLLMLMDKAIIERDDKALEMLSNTYIGKCNQHIAALVSLSNSLSGASKQTQLTGSRLRMVTVTPRYLSKIGRLLDSVYR
jgi:hypothetical protein